MRRERERGGREGERGGRERGERGGRESGERRGKEGRGAEYTYDARCSCCTDTIVCHKYKSTGKGRESKEIAMAHTQPHTPPFFFKIIYLVAKLDIRYVILLPRCLVWVETAEVW